MRKKILTVLLLGLCIALAGCGKKNSRVDYYENELGMDHEEAEAMAELAEMFEDDYDDEEDSSTDASQPDGFALVQPSSEIVNSKLTDMIVQIGNVVLKYDGSMTVGECYDALSQEFNTTITAVDINNREYNMDSLITNDEFAFWFHDENDEGMCYMWCVNPTGQPLKFSECTVIEIKQDHTPKYNLNTFYAGNICPGIFTNSESVTSTQNYITRAAEYPRPTYYTITDYIQSLGMDYPSLYVEETQDTRSNTYKYIVYDLSPNAVFAKDGTDYYTLREMHFVIDMATTECSSFASYTSYGADDGNTSAKWYGSQQLMSMKDQMMAAYDEINAYARNNCDTLTEMDGELVGYVDGYGLILIYRMNDGTYTTLKAGGVSIMYNGSLSLGNVSVEKTGLADMEAVVSSISVYITVDDVAMLRE